MSRVIAAGFVALAVLHAPAAVGALSPDTLVSLYGPAAGEAEMRVVLQHRGTLFALVTLGCLVAAARPRWRDGVAILTGWSMAAFLGLYLVAGAPAGPLRKIAIADALGLALLAALAIALWRERGTRLPGDGVEVPEVEGLAVGEGDGP